MNLSTLVLPGPVLASLALGYAPPGRRMLRIHSAGPRHPETRSHIIPDVFVEVFWDKISI